MLAPFTILFGPLQLAGDGGGVRFDSQAGGRQKAENQLLGGTFLFWL